MDTWLRIAIFALILISFLRRIFKAKAQGRIPSPTNRGNLPQTLARPRQGRKNDFRDVPPPPENPELG
jgi:hypothetical protein